MKQQLKEGVDYYFNDEGLVVFTANYLRERGYCCGNGCIHCPYDYAAVQNANRREVLLKAREKSA